MDDSRATVMVVDDVLMNVKILEKQLSETFNVLSAISGKEAIELAKTSAVQLILLDIFMPEMDGFAVAKELQANPATRAIPVVFLSGDNDLSLKIKAYQHGAKAFLTKPFDKQVVIDTIQTHLQPQ